MNCRRVKKLLETYLDGDLAGRAKERLEDHLESCAVCSEQLANARRALSALESLERARPPVGFTKSVMARLHGDAENRRPRRIPNVLTILRAPYLRTAGVAAAVVLLTTLVGYLHNVRTERKIEELLARAEVGLELGEIERACTAYRNVIDLDSESVKGHSGLAYAFWLLGEDTDAAAHYREVIRLITEVRHSAHVGDTRLLAVTYESLGKIYHDGGSLDEAIDCYESALAIDSDLIDAHYNLATIYDQMNMVSEAIDEYEAVVKLAPTHTSARESLGRLYEMSGAIDEAVAQYQRCIEASDSPTASLRLGRIYERLGMLDKAVAAYQMVVFGETKANM